MSIRGTFASVDDLKIIDNPTIDDVAIVGNQMYQYKDGWQPIDTTDKKFDIGLTEYQLNQMVVKQLPDYTNLYKAKKIIRDFTHKQGQVFMLLCHELRYYTVLYLEKEGYDKIEDIVIECLQGMGTIKDISKEDGAIGCWVLTPEDDEAHMFFLFNYDGGFERCV